MTTPFQSHEFQAMGSQMCVYLESTPKDARRAFAVVEDYFRVCEAIFTRFDASSELSRVNREGGGQVSTIFYTVVKEALQLAESTNGYFDPTLLRNLEKAGYQQSFTPDRSIVEWSCTSIAPQSRYQSVVLDEAKRSVQLLNGVKLDLNGIVKGWTAQIVCDAIRAMGPCLIDAGGDIVAGDAPKWSRGWLVSVAAPNDGKGPTKDLFGLWLENAAIATSGIDYRRWMLNNQPKHHLIDPFTGQPTITDAQTVTVVAADATYADAWATAGCVMGSKKGLSIFEEQQIAGCFSNPNIYTPTTALQPHIIKNSWQGLIS